MEASVAHITIERKQFECEKQALKRMVELLNK